MYFQTELALILAIHTIKRKCVWANTHTKNYTQTFYLSHTQAHTSSHIYMHAHTRIDCHKYPGKRS